MLMENNGKLSKNDPGYPLLSGMLKHQEKDFTIIEALMSSNGKEAKI